MPYVKEHITCLLVLADHVSAINDWGVLQLSN
jgi:hypothetical protein